MEVGIFEMKLQGSVPAGGAVLGLLSLLFRDLENI